MGKNPFIGLTPEKVGKTHAAYLNGSRGARKVKINNKAREFYKEWKLKQNPCDIAIARSTLISRMSFYNKELKKRNARKKILISKAIKESTLSPDSLRGPGDGSDNTPDGDRRSAFGL